MREATDGILIGIDLGGTNVRVGVLSPDGHLLAWQAASMEAALGPAAGLQKIAQLVAKALEQVQQPLLALGIGSTGPLDRARGCIQNPYTLPGWEDVDIASPLREKFGAPVALENDADAAALGESWVGAGRGLARMAMVTIGTGVGYALVVDGNIYRGVGEAHPEGGHIILDPSGPECYCGARGCWESLVSGPAIAQFARSAHGLESSMLIRECRGDPEQIDAESIFRVARMGDRFSQQIVERTADYIGLGLVSLMMLTLPDCIVMTGGVLRSFDLLEGRIRAVIARHNVIIPSEKIAIQPASLSQQAGVFGAARAAWLLYTKDKE